jgi:ribosomal-protein-alanine N-acetyltransferase
MLYRLFQPDDFRQLYAIEEVCFQPPFRFSRAFMYKLTASRRTITWIAEEDSNEKDSHEGNGREGNKLMAGFAIVAINRGAAPPSAYIQTLEVLPDRRGQGIGAELLRRIESSAIAAGVQSVQLHVDTENSTAIRLYESHGYQPQGREEDYYARHRPALVYAKSLAPQSLT